MPKASTERQNTPTDDPRARYTRERAKLESLTNDLARITAQRSAIIDAPAVDPARQHIESAAMALLDGVPSVDETPNRTDALTALAKQRRVIEQAIAIQSRRVDEAKAVQDAVIRSEHEPRIRAKNEALAIALAAVANAYADVDAEYAALAQQDVVVAPIFHVHIGALNAANPESRINAWLDELEREFEIRVDRSSRDASIGRRNAFDTEEMQSKIRQGGAVQAGPDGVRVSLPGGQFVSVEEEANYRRARRRGILERLASGFSDKE